MELASKTAGLSYDLVDQCLGVFLGNVLGADNFAIDRVNVNDELTKPRSKLS